MKDAILLPPPAPTLQLADLLRQCRNWAEVECAIATHPAHKTEAWQVLTLEEKSRIKVLRQRATEVPPLKIGSRVLWIGCPGYLEFLSPFTVRAVEEDAVWLDWIAHPVQRSKLILE